MKAYVLVLREPYEGDVIFGVYNNMERAKRAFSDIKQDYDFSKFKILEVLMDEEPSWLVGKVIDLN